ncbi:hypothetical protein L6452_19393 [Arctium lappa]|uniref:Uncharacterized protein n=1 Tax=Arctium lappa TaxID=4217 RepID=A0ACB9B813_ARCLA|nr:hypothetical protein L6452_19393 [Arctium lappa]
MKGDESSSENSPNKHPSPSKNISKEKQLPTQRLTRSYSRFKTKPMTENKGSAISLSRDSTGENANEVDYEVVVSKLSNTALDALAAVAGAEVQTPETTPVQANMIIPIEATSVAINPSPIEAYVDKAFATMDELLGRRAIQATTVNTTIATTLETPPVIPENFITKPTENPSVKAPIISKSPIPTPLTTPIPTPINSPLITPVTTPKVTKTPPLVSPSKIRDDTLSEHLGNNLTPKHQEQQSVNPTPPNMAIDSPVDEAQTQFSPRAVEHSPSISHVSPVDTTTTPLTVGDAQEEDEEVDMTRVKRRTLSKKKLEAKKKQKKAKEVEVAEMLMRFTNNPRPPNVIEAVEEMKNNILGEIQKATTKLKKTFKARTDKLKGKNNELHTKVKTLKEERVKWLEYRREKDRVKKIEWQKINPDKQMTLPPFPTVCLQKLAPTPTHFE